MCEYKEFSFLVLNHVICFILLKLSYYIFVLMLFRTLLVLIMVGSGCCRFAVINSVKNGRAGKIAGVGNLALSPFLLPGTNTLWHSKANSLSVGPNSSVKFWQLRFATFPSLSAFFHIFEPQICMHSYCLSIRQGRSLSLLLDVDLTTGWGSAQLKVSFWLLSMVAGHLSGLIFKILLLSLPYLNYFLNLLIFSEVTLYQLIKMGLQTFFSWHDIFYMISGEREKNSIILEIFHQWKILTCIYWAQTNFIKNRDITHRR